MESQMNCFTLEGQTSKMQDGMCFNPGSPWPPFLSPVGLRVSPFF